MLKALVERMEAFGKKLEAKTAASKLRKTPAQFGPSFGDMFVTAYFFVVGGSVLAYRLDGNSSVAHSKMLACPLIDKRLRQQLDQHPEVLRQLGVSSSDAIVFDRIQPIREHKKRTSAAAFVRARGADGVGISAPSMTLKVSVESRNAEATVAFYERWQSEREEQERKNATPASERPVDLSAPPVDKKAEMNAAIAQAGLNYTVAPFVDLLGLNALTNLVLDKSQAITEPPKAIGDPIKADDWRFTEVSIVKKFGEAPTLLFRENKENVAPPTMSKTEHLDSLGVPIAGHQMAVLLVVGSVLTAGVHVLRNRSMMKLGTKPITCALGSRAMSHPAVRNAFKCTSAQDVIHFQELRGQESHGILNLQFQCKGPENVVGTIEFQALRAPSKAEMEKHAASNQTATSTGGDEKSSSMRPRSARLHAATSATAAPTPVTEFEVGSDQIDTVPNETWNIIHSAIQVGKEKHAFQLCQDDKLCVRTL